MEAVESGEIEISNPYFDILASGKFGEGDISARLSLNTTKPKELIEETESIWEETNSKRVSEGKTPLKAEPQLSLKGVNVVDGKLNIELASSSYKDHIAMQNKDLRARYAEYAPRVLGTNVLVKTADGQLIVAQRGLDAATKPGALSVPGGQPNFSTDLRGEDNWDPFATVKRELTEEAGIETNELTDIKASGIIYNKAANNPSMIFFAETNLSADQIRSRATDREINIKFIPDTKEDIEHAILWWAFSPSKSGASALALYGREKFGEEWFRWINERLEKREEKYKTLDSEQLAKLNKRASERISNLGERGDIEKREFEKFNVEALSKGKAKNDPSKNEDMWLAKDYLIAVIDGATPKGNLSFGQESGGQYAAKLVSEALTSAEAKNLTGQELVDFVSRYMERSFTSDGYFSSIENSPEARPTSSFVAAKIIEDKIVITQVGDVSFRINRLAVHQDSKEVDNINSKKRKETIERIKSENPDIERDELLKQGREEIVDVLNNQVARLQNNPQEELGFGAMDGRKVPEQFVRTFTYDLKDVGLLEVFSDGYFKIADKPTIESWEEAFRYVEEVDPDKIGEFPSTKGSTLESYTDDRTVIIAHFK